MFKRYTLYTSLICGLTGLLWLFSIAWMQTGDKERYQRLLKRKQEISSASKSLSSSTHQVREEVRKDLYVAQSDASSRLHYQIKSKKSLLTLVPSGRHFDITENLEGVVCAMQDKLYASGQAPMQQMRYFEADHGVYRYTSQQLVAQDVSLSLFRIPGHELPPAIDPRLAFLKGIAQDVSFSIAGNTPQFQAKHFKASFKE
jgi:hypothetical protein